MGVFDFLRAAIQPAAAARAGYLEGQHEQRAENRTIALQDEARKRQGALDTIKAALDQSQIDRNNRMPVVRDTYDQIVAPDGTVYLRNRNDPTDIRKALDDDGKPIKARTPPDPAETHRQNRDYDVAHPLPARPTSGSTAQDRLDAKTALDEALAAIPRPSKVPQNILGVDAKGRASIVSNPARAQAVKDSVAYETSTIKPLRQHLLDVTIGTKVPLGGSAGGAGGSSGSSGSSKPGLSQRAPLSADRSAAMQREFDAASADLQAVLQSDASPAVKAQARALYDRQQKAIAERYGATNASGAETIPDDD